MNNRLSYVALSVALLCTPALAQETAPTSASPTPTSADTASPAVTSDATAAPPAAETPPTAPADQAPVAETPAASEMPAAASADPRVGAPAAGKAQIVFFRPWNYFGGAVSFTIKEGDTAIAKVTNGRYYIYAADPGTHAYHVTSEATDALTLDLDEGETYYVKETMDMGVVLYRPNMAPSDAAAFAGYPKLKLAAPPKVDKPKV